MSLLRLTRLLPAFLILPIAACNGGSSLTPSAAIAQGAASHAPTARRAMRARPFLQPADLVEIAGTTPTGTGAVVEFTINLSNTPAFGNVITAGINDPSIMADDSNFDLFVLNAHGNAASAKAPSITEYNASRALTATISKGLIGAVPTSMTVGYDSTPYLFVNDNAGTTHQVIGYAPPYAAPFVKLTPPGGTTIFQVLLDQADDLVVVTASGVYEYAAPYTGAPSTIYATSSTPTNVPHSCAIDSFGNLWIGLTQSILGYTGGFPNPATPSTTITFPTNTAGVKELAFSYQTLTALRQMNAAGDANIIAIPSPYTTLGTVVTNSTKIPSLKSPSSSIGQFSIGEFGSLYVAPRLGAAGSPVYDYLLEAGSPISIAPPAPAGFKPTAVFHD
jgi:hypothetical protein